MKTIEEMAREAGDDWDHTRKEDRKFLERFAALVAAEERKACLMACAEDAHVVEWKGLAEAVRRISARGNT